METQSISNLISALASLSTVLIVGYDIWRRYQTKSVSFVRVPTRNNHGYTEYQTALHDPNPEMTSAWDIKIQANGSAEITLIDYSKVYYASPILWISNRPKTQK